MTEGENKRVVKKSNNKDTMNIKVSTKDKNSLSNKKEINLNIDGQTKSRNNTTKKNSSLKTQPNNNKQDSNLENIISKLIEKNQNLEKEMESLNSLLNSEREKEISEITSLNEDISQLTNTQIELNNENKRILSKFIGLEGKVSKKFTNKFKESKIVENLKHNKNKPDKEKEIKMKEKQQKPVEKSIKYNQKEIQKLSDLINQSNTSGESQLMQELKELNQKIQKLETENEEFNKIKHDHKFCVGVKNNLQSKLNILTNEFEFELKRKNMLPVETKEQTRIKNNNTLDYGENVRKKMLKNAKKKYNSKIKLVNYKSYNFIVKKINESQKEKETEKKMIYNRSSQTEGNLENYNYYSYLRTKINPRIDTENPKDFLFSERDKELLQHLIPNEYYNNYNEKFNQAEKEINDIKEYFKDHEPIKKEINLYTIKYEALNLGLKELYQENANLSSIASKNATKITQLNKEIQKLNEQYKKQELLLSKLEKYKKAIKKKCLNNKKKNEKLLQTDI